MLTYPNVKDDLSSSSSSNDKNRFPLSGSIDQITSDIQRIKAMGVDHIVFGYNFVPIGRDVTKVIDLSKELSKFAR
jgi:predicted metal-dependent phosphotriesterase family hydrolase